MKASISTLVLLVLLSLHPLLAQQINLADLQARVAKNDPEAEFQLGRAYHTGTEGVPKDFAKAAELYHKAAAQGNGKAMYGLGCLYHFAQGVPKDNTVAQQWFQKAADKAVAAAELEMGLAYYHGDNGLKKDDNVAAKWLLLASQPSSPPVVRGSAANALAYLFETGDGVAQNSQQAVFWYTQAANDGNGQAMGNLGRIYAEGHLVKKDPVQAYMWLKLGAFQSDQQSMHLVSDYLAGNFFTDKDKAGGDRLADDFRRKHNEAPLVGPVPTVLTPGSLELAEMKKKAQEAKAAQAAGATNSAAANAPAARVGANSVGH